MSRDLQQKNPKIIYQINSISAGCYADDITITLSRLLAQTVSRTKAGTSLKLPHGEINAKATIMLTGVAMREYLLLSLNLRLICNHR